jgi:hypothetical protein
MGASDEEIKQVHRADKARIDEIKDRFRIPVPRPAASVENLQYSESCSTG